MKKSIMLSILLSCALQAAATIFVYKDAKGNMVYSDLPLYHLQEIKKEEPGLPNTTSQSQSTGQQTQQGKKNLTPEEYNKQVAEQNKTIMDKNKQIDEKNRQLVEENKKRQEEDKKQAAATKDQNCQIARGNLENAENGRQSNKEEAVKRAREQVNLHCK